MKLFQIKEKDFIKIKFFLKTFVSHHAIAEIKLINDLIRKFLIIYDWN